MRRYWIACLPLLALTACKDTSGPGDTLSREEALAVAAQVLASGEGVTTSLNASASTADQSSAAGVPTTFTHTHESSHPCPSGGRVNFDLQVQGSFDTEARAFEVDVEGSQTHDDCAFPHKGLVVTLDGNPDIDFSAHAAADNGQPSEPFTANVDGAFRWSTSDGRSGVCAVTVESVTDFAAKRKTVEGDICGHTVTEVTTWS
jgi:hypothetical protein